MSDPLLKFFMPRSQRDYFGSLGRGGGIKMHYLALVKVYANDEEEAREMLEKAFQEAYNKYHIDYYCILATIKLEDPCLGHYTDILIEMIEKPFRDMHQSSIRILEKDIMDFETNDPEFANYLREMLKDLREFKWVPAKGIIILNEPPVDITRPPGGLTWKQHAEWQMRLKSHWGGIFYFIIDFHW